MQKPKLSEAERLAAVQAEIARLQARAKKLGAEKRAKDARIAQRRAFLIGEALAAESSIAEPFKGYLAGVLDRHVKRPTDRALLADFLGEVGTRTDSPDAAA